jgi:hypothetical protein
MNATCSDTSIPLEKRWKYSQKLAIWINKNVNNENVELMNLKNQLENYFSLLKKTHIDEKYLYEFKSKNGAVKKEILYMCILFLPAILGIFHCGLFYFLCKKFVEKKFKRKVFWSSVKLLTGKITMGLFNIPFIFLFYKFIYPSYILAFLYYVSIGLFGLSAYMWFRNYKSYKIKCKMKKMNLNKIWNKRLELYSKIKKLIPIA